MSLVHKLSAKPTKDSEARKVFSAARREQLRKQGPMTVEKVEVLQQTMKAGR